MEETTLEKPKFRFLVDTMPPPYSKGRGVRADLVKKLRAINVEYRNITISQIGKGKEKLPLLTKLLVV